jgi:NTP pyrophosphatase (non-canonical NTP hydrolase)
VPHGRAAPTAATAAAVSTPSPGLDELVRRLVAFRDARDWRQFHSLKDLVVSLNLEAAELLELTQWKPEAAFEEAAGTEAGRDAVAGECADVLIYLLLISERLGIDLCDAVARKIEINEARYPVSKSRGNARKYSEL